MNENLRIALAIIFTLFSGLLVSFGFLLMG